MISRSEFTKLRTGDLSDSADAADGIPIRVWIVDDDRSYRTLLADILAQEGEVECVRQFDSVGALMSALRSGERPEAILLDISIGHESGLDALPWIKEDVRSVPVLMLTTFLDTQQKARAQRDGASDFLLKRFPVEEISRRIRRVCRAEAADYRQDSANAELHGGSTERFPEWPEHRAPFSRGERHHRDDISQASSDSGHPGARWRSASRRLARGVRYLRTLMGSVF